LIFTRSLKSLGFVKKLRKAKQSKKAKQTINAKICCLKGNSL